MFLLNARASAASLDFIRVVHAVVLAVVLAVVRPGVVPPNPSTPRHPSRALATPSPIDVHARFHRIARAIARALSLVLDIADVDAPSRGREEATSTSGASRWDLEVRV